MRIHGVRVWVDDIERARNFYGGALGLKAVWELQAAMGYDLGAILIVEEAKDDPEHVGRFVGVSISVSDIEAAYNELSAKGVAFLAAPEKMPWGGTLAHFRDPSGNVLTLLG